jgi:hypothetical protein
MQFSTQNPLHVKKKKKKKKNWTGALVCLCTKLLLSHIPSHYQIFPVTIDLLYRGSLILCKLSYRGKWISYLTVHLQHRILLGERARISIRSRTLWAAW